MCATLEVVWSIDAISNSDLGFYRLVCFEKWKVKELLDLKEFFKLKKIENRGQYIFKEGENSAKFIVIKNGEFEIAKTDLRNVYFNKTSGIVGIKEDNVANVGEAIELSEYKLLL